MEGNIEYLYHYTNIETLALILKHHTFRFSSLDKMDDLQEQETGDIKNVGQFCYISSWTDDETENIPMWNMYTSIASGIRIRLRKMPFKVYENTPADLQEVTNTPVTDSSGGNYLKSIIPIADMFRKGYICPAAMSQDILFKVEYTAERDKLYPKLLTTNGDRFTIALGEMGKYKNTHWAFQKEWRYILIFLPLNLNQPVEKSSSDAQIMGNKILHGLEKQPFPFFDMVLDDEAYSDMEITLSPQISAGNRLIVESLIEKYNPRATIKDSSLVGLI